MSTRKETMRHHASSYKKGALWLIVGMTLAGLLFTQLAMKGGQTYSLLFSAVYFLVVTFANSCCWRKAAERAGNLLTQYYFASSVARMLLAFVVLLVGMFLLRDDKAQMLGFTLTFATYFVVLLIFDCIFFSRIEKKHLIN